MVPLIIGGGMMLAGTAMNLYGTSQRDKATAQAMKDYQAAVAAKTAADQKALSQQGGLLAGLGRERQAGVGQYINALSAENGLQYDDGFSGRQQGMLTDMAKMTGGNASGYAYSGAPRSEAEGQQAGITGADNKRIAEAMLADHQTRMMDEREKMAGHKMAFGDLLRGNKGKSINEKFQLAQALRDLDWQRKTAAMQGQMDEASRKGQTMSMLGSLGTQAGSMLAMYGLSEGMGGGPQTSGGPYGANSPGALDMQTVNPGQV